MIGEGLSKKKKKNWEANGWVGLILIVGHLVDISYLVSDIRWLSNLIVLLHFLFRILLESATSMTFFLYPGVIIVRLDTKSAIRRTK